MTQPQQQQQNPPMHQPMSDHIYTCNKLHDGDEWMLADINTHTFACTWTKSHDKAMVYSSEQEVQDMIDMFPVLIDCHIGRVLVGY